MGKQTVNILYQSSDAYAPYTGVSITSLFENNKHLEDIHVYLLDDGISEENKEKFHALERQYGREIELVDTGKIREQIENTGLEIYHGAYTPYYRLFAPDMLGDLDRLLYIDSDTIINDKIDKLYYVELGDNVCAMVQDPLPFDYLKLLGLSKEDYYYNTGVILYSVRKYREMNLKKRFLSQISAKDVCYIFADQDIMNLSLTHRIKRLEPECNFIAKYLYYGENSSLTMTGTNSLQNYYTAKELKRAGKQAIIYHFISITQIPPWTYENALSNLYDKYLLHSYWKDMDKNYSLPFLTKIQFSMQKVLPQSLYEKIRYDYIRIYIKLRWMAMKRNKRI